MANYIKVATLGPLPYSISPDMDNENVIAQMKRHWQTQLDKVLPDKPDLIVLPEQCDRPQYFPKERLHSYYTGKKEQMRDFFREIAANNNCYIAYSSAREIDDGTRRNSTQIIDRYGNIAGIYNKNHVVIEETTEDNILCGKDTPLIKCDFGNVACIICFDLNFDEIKLKTKAIKPDIILFSSMYHGGIMQEYWAYFCRAHFISAVVGQPCAVISPVGMKLAESTNYFNYCMTDINLDCAVIHLDYNWGKMNAVKQKYGSKVKISDPGYLGAMLISSETDEFCINDIIKEFDIEIWDDYMTRALNHRKNNTEE